MISQETAKQAIFALLDVLDGQQSHDIEYMTGLPPERCAEIAALRSQLYTEHKTEWLR